MKHIYFLYFSILFMACAGQNDTSILQQILNNIRSAVLENTNRTESVQQVLSSIREAALANSNQENSYQQMLDNIRSTVQEFSVAVNQSSLARAAQILNELSQLVNIKQLITAFNTSNVNQAGLFGSLQALKLNSTIQQASPKCINDTNNISAGLAQGKDWAFRMLDAAAKPPSGLMNFKLVWLGDYEECMAVKAESFNGQYCLSTFMIVSLQNPLTQTQGIPIQLGYCLPDSCSKDDGLILMNSVVPRLTNNQVYVIDLKCQEPDRPYDKRAIISFSVIAAFILIMGIATAYDVIITHYLKTKEKSANTYKEFGENGKDKDPNVHTSIEYEPGQKEKESENQIEEATNKESKINADKKLDLKSKVVKSIGNIKDGTYKPGVPGQLLLSFSVYTNVPKLLSTKQGAGTLTAINGIRFISMTWVILGHTFGFGLQNGGVVNTATAYPGFISRKSFMAIMNAEVSVDTFFALSGTLLAYLVLKQLKKEKGKLNWFMFYFHRFWRKMFNWLRPLHLSALCVPFNVIFHFYVEVQQVNLPYMLVMMVYIPLFPYLGSGPFWKKDGMEVTYCEDSWWYNLLYINNFRDVAKECVAWTWYLANDMQFYVISPLIILPMFFSKIAGMIVTAVFLIGAIVSPAVISMHRDLGISAVTGGEVYFNQYYQRPYCRMGPYLVGMLTGYILYKTECRCKINKYLNVFLWTIFATFACLVLYGVYDNFNGNPMSRDVAALYNAVHRTVWGSAVCWVIFSCATGNGGFINTLLSWKVFVPLGRLTYCAYLIHPIIQYYYYGSRKELLYWDNHSIICEYLAHLILSYAAAFILSLAFESPMMGLEKVVFRRNRKNK